jgi:thiol:disulfide interchange protein
MLQWLNIALIGDFMGVLLSHWHCMLPVFAIVAVLLLQGKKKRG